MPKCLRFAYTGNEKLEETLTSRLHYEIGRKYMLKKVGDLWNKTNKRHDLKISINLRNQHEMATLLICKKHESTQVSYDSM